MTGSRHPANASATAAGPDHPALLARSRQLITDLQSETGAYPASPTFSAYAGYAWLRDGSFTAEAASRWNVTASADRFHDWVARVLTERREQVTSLVTARRGGDHPDRQQMLPTRFTLDGRDGSDDWWDYQTDGYGMWLWAVHAHARRHTLTLDRWRAGIDIAVDYLTAFGTDPCYDWWEEHPDHVHVSTLAANHAGLMAAATDPDLTTQRRTAAAATAQRIRSLIAAHGTTPVSRTTDRGPRRLVKWLDGTDIDASLAACIVPFGVYSVDDPIAAATIDAITARLDNDGGVHRYPSDEFFGGGRWPLLSCLLGWNHAAAGHQEAAWRYLNWAAAQATTDGDLPEQSDGHLLNPDRRQAWIDRWGPVATPLVWSHAMYLILAHELGLGGGSQK